MEELGFFFFFLFYVCALLDIFCVDIVMMRKRITPGWDKDWGGFLFLWQGSSMQNTTTVTQSIKEWVCIFFLLYFSPERNGTLSFHYCCTAFH